MRNVFRSRMAGQSQDSAQQVGGRKTHDRQHFGKTSHDLTWARLNT